MQMARAENRESFWKGLQSQTARDLGGCSRISPQCASSHFEGREEFQYRGSSKAGC